MKWQEPHILTDSIAFLHAGGGYWIRDCSKVACPSLAKCLRTDSAWHKSSSGASSNEKVANVCNTNQQISVSYWLLSMHLMISKCLKDAFTFRLFLHMRKEDCILSLAFYKAYLFAFSKLILLFSYYTSIPVTPISPQINVNAKPSFSSNTLPQQSICDTTHYRCSVKSVSE